MRYELRCLFLFLSDRLIIQPLITNAILIIADAVFLDLVHQYYLHGAYQKPSQFEIVG